MSKVEELLAKYNPNGVFQSDLREVSSIIRGKRVTKRDVKERGDYPVISGGESPMGYYDTFNREANTITIAQYGAAGYVDFQKNKFWANDVCYSILPFESVDNKYLYYTLKSKQNFIYSIRNTDAVPFSLPINTLYSIQIPLPHIKVQEEIVKILDSFTNLIDALNEELSLRQKQFEYYREKLLTFDDKSINVNITPLGEIGNVCMCKRIMRNETNNEGGIPFYKIGTFGGIADSFISKDKFEEYKNKYNYPKLGDILISASGTIGKTVVFDGKPSYYQDSNIVWIDNDETKVINSFLRYIYTVIDWKVDDGGVIKRLYNTNIRSTLITYPKEKAVQQSIVEKLDAFESLISSLKEEIALRQKQYEYYREKLLTFD